MGLWEYCFENFRYPYYQFDKLFNGCHHIFSQEYYVIIEWLLPGWLMVVQAFVTLALLISFFGQAILILILIRFPLKFVLENEWLLSSIVCVCNGIAGKLNSKIDLTVNVEKIIIKSIFTFRCIIISCCFNFRRPMLEERLDDVSKF
jgi:hypothetical protein